MSVIRCVSIYIRILCSVFLYNQRVSTSLVQSVTGGHECGRALTYINGLYLAKFPSGKEKNEAHEICVCVASFNFLINHTISTKFGEQLFPKITTWRKHELLGCKLHKRHLY
jgi:hypothetical protein